jgi:hypothetical protein
MCVLRTLTSCVTARGYLCLLCTERTAAPWETVCVGVLLQQAAELGGKIASLTGQEGKRAADYWVCYRELVRHNLTGRYCQHPSAVNEIAGSLVAAWQCSCLCQAHVAQRQLPSWCVETCVYCLVRLQLLMWQLSVVAAGVAPIVTLVAAPLSTAS